ncbi:MAG: hypothetical protein NTW21_39355 [Verrucomicrobia bacterium]|nr:hypothetical protein [Verrucomicrobiota bacterium]
MSHENAKILYQASHEAQQKFEYFLTGAIGAMFAYTAQTYTPKKLDFSPSTLEPIAVICFAVAFFLGLRRLDCLYHILGVNYEKTHADADAAVIQKALRMIENDPLLRYQPGTSLEEMEKELEWNRIRSRSAKPILDDLKTRIRTFYNWRSRLLLVGFALIVLARVLSPYSAATKPQTQQTDHKASEPQEVTTKVQAIQSPLKK